MAVGINAYLHHQAPALVILLSVGIDWCAIDG